MTVPQMGVSENGGTLFGVLIIRILLFRVLYWGPLFTVPQMDQHSLYRTLLAFHAVSIATKLMLALAPPAGRED